MNNIKLILFAVITLCSGFCSQVFAENVSLQYQVGKTAEIMITQKVEGDINIYGYEETIQSVGTIRMEVTLLDGGKQGRPIEVGVIVRDLHYSEPEESMFIDTPSMTSSSAPDEVLALNCICDLLINQPLHFTIKGDYSVIESSNILAQIRRDCEDIVPSFGTSLNFFSYVLGQMFHLKEVPLKVDCAVKIPVINWLDYDDEPFSRMDCEIEDSGVYTIKHIKEDTITASWQGNASFLNGKGCGSVVLNADVEWNSSNALIQNRKLKVEMQEFFNFGLTCDVIIEEDWVSCLLENA